MKFKYLIQKIVNDGWENQEEIGLFDSVEDANDEIYLLIENKEDFWTQYRVMQCIVK